MAAVEAGITDLYGQLINQYLPKEHRRCRPMTLKGDRAKMKRILFAKTYDILLFQSRIKAHDQKSKEPELSELNQILGHVFSLRCARKFDAASLLKNRLDRIKSIAEVDDSVCSVLRLILKLAGTCPQTDEESMPIVCHSSKSNVLLPPGPLWYGDSRVSYTDSPYYTMYASNSFQNLMQIDLDFNANILKSLPGSGVSKFFSNKDERNNKNSRTLFGALVESKSYSVNPYTKLELPSIDEHIGSLQIRIPSQSPTLTDEGLHTGNDNSSVTENVENETDIWEEALKLPSRRPVQSWDVKAKPYVSEAGFDALNQLYCYHQSLLATADPSYVPVLQIYVNVQHLLRDAIFLLLGVPSRIFILDKNNSEFGVQPGICVSGTTPQAFKNMLKPILECGSLYHRLEEFSKPPILNSFYNQGLVFQAFTTAIRKYLRMYEAFILSISERSVSTLMNKCHRVFKQMRFIAELCQVSMNLNKVEITENRSNFPIGLKLLSYLYEYALASSGSENYQVMLSILRTSSTPYMNFIQKWVYHGICHDPFEEFMIRINNDFIFFRDKYYWNRGYELVTPESNEMTLFLNDILTEIYNCGKAINLLKLCCPEHFMCNISMDDVPKLTISYDCEQLKKIQKDMNAYVSRAEQVARRSLVTRKELLERDERARLELIQKGREAAQERLEKARIEALKERAALHSKKQKLFLELKLEMEKDQERKKELIEQQKAEDKVFMESLTDRENQKSELELRLEEQAREELVRHYEKLTAQALSRERRALWKMERLKLSVARNAMLEKEEIELKNEYEKFLAEKLVEEDVKEAFDVDISDFIPKSNVDDVEAKINDVDVAIDRLLDITVNPMTSHADVENVGRNILDMTVPDLAVGGVPNLPKWAQKALLNEGVTTVDDQSKNQEFDSSNNANDTENSNDIVFGDVMKENGEESAENVDEKISHDNVNDARNSEVSDSSVSRVNEETTEIERKPSKKSVFNRHVGETTYNFINSEPYEITVPNLRPIDEILNDSALDTSFEICRRSFIQSPKKVDKESESREGVRDEKFKQTNSHGKHPSQTTVLEKDVVTTKNSKICEETTEKIDTAVVRFKEKNVHGHSSDSQIKIQDGSSPRKWASEKQRAFESNEAEIVQNFDLQRFKNQHVSDETVGVDFDELRKKKFERLNKQGHSTRTAKSSVQTLLYGEKFGVVNSKDEVSVSKTEEENAGDIKINPEPWLGKGVELYKDDFDEIYESPIYDMADRVYKTSSTFENVDAENVSAHEHVSLPVLLKRSIVGPILAQISLANRSLVTYFFQDLLVDRHFEAMKLFMFLEDGEFGETLGDIMFEKLAHDPLPHEVFNTAFLSGALTKAIRASNIATDMYEYVLLGNKYLPEASEMSGPRALDCLELNYQVDWPLNIVITDSCLLRYNMIFCLMLQLKRVTWCMNDTWYRLKRDSLINIGADLNQFRVLQLHRHEMQNFVRVVQSYISNQIIHVSWKEFQSDLMDNVQTLDDLHDIHAAYLNKAIFRCLLSKKAGSMMKIIQDIIGLILRFHSQLLSAGWQQSGTSVSHPGFDSMEQTYRSFRDYSMFLFKVIRKVTARGYQPHLEELLLRLNFNDYYTTRQRIS